MHEWLADKNLITQNIDGLDGNDNYIAIHGRLDQMTVFHDQEHAESVEAVATPWDTEYFFTPSYLQPHNFPDREIFA